MQTVLLAQCQQSPNLKSINWSQSMLVLSEPFRFSHRPRKFFNVHSSQCHNHYNIINATQGNSPIKETTKQHNATIFIWADHFLSSPDILVDWSPNFNDSMILVPILLWCWCLPCWRVWFSGWKLDWSQSRASRHLCLVMPNLWEALFTLELKHRKNCECCPMSLLIVR